VRGGKSLAGDRGNGIGGLSPCEERKGSQGIAEKLKICFSRNMRGRKEKFASKALIEFGFV